MTQKTFEVAGTSTINGVTKVRFANDYVGRFKILLKNNHENIELIELGSKLSKAEICQVLLNHPKFQSEEQQTAIAEFAVRNVKGEVATNVEQPVNAESEDSITAQALYDPGRLVCNSRGTPIESGGAHWTFIFYAAHLSQQP